MCAWRGDRRRRSNTPRPAGGADDVPEIKVEGDEDAILCDPHGRRDPDPAMCRGQYRAHGLRRDALAATSPPLPATGSYRAKTAFSGSAGGDILAREPCRVSQSLTDVLGFQIRIVVEFSSRDAPSAIRPTMRPTVMRRPRIHALPPILPGSNVILSKPPSAGAGVRMVRLSGMANRGLSMRDGIIPHSPTKGQAAAAASAEPASEARRGSTRLAHREAQARQQQLAALGVAVR
jgi:hypothetical protein